jgi:phosphatidylglycerophosphate synthase
MKNTPYEVTERRPIKSRNTRWAEVATRLLVKCGVTPNGVSLFSMVAASGAGLAFYSTCLTSGIGLQTRAFWLLGGILCVVRLLCNLLDGMIAVETNVASAKGELYNEVPDRFSDAVILIGLGYSVGGFPALGFLASLVAVFVAYVRVMAKSLGAANNFCGPMAKPHRMAIVIACAVFTAISPSTWRFSCTAANIALVVIIIGGLATAFRRLRFAAHHLEGSNNDDARTAL